VMWVQRLESSASCSEEANERVSQGMGASRIVGNSYRVESDGSEDQVLVGGDSGLGVVSDVAESKTARDPVVGTVLVEVEDGHGGVAELVDQEGLQLPLHKVGHNHVEHQARQGEITTQPTHRR